MPFTRLLTILVIARNTFLHGDFTASLVTGSGRGGLDPESRAIFLEIPESRSLFLSFPESHTLGKCFLNISYL